MPSQDCPGYHVSPIPRAHLQTNVFDVAIDRAGGDSNLTGSFLRRITIRNQLEDLLLAR